MKVSVIVPVYRVPGRYLEACFDSILAQSMGDLELIAVNDASPEAATAERLAEYAARDRRIRILTHERNMGVSEARNSGVASAVGEYFCFVDADDWIDADYLETLLAVAEKERCDMVFSGFRRMRDDGRVLKVRRPGEWGRGKTKAELFDELNFAVWNKLFRRAALQSLRMRGDLRIGEDIVYVFAAFLRSDRVRPVAVAKYAYRMNPESATSRERDGVASIVNNLVILPALSELLAAGRDTDPELRSRAECYILGQYIRYTNKFHRMTDPARRGHLWAEWGRLYTDCVARLARGFGMVHLLINRGVAGGGSRPNRAVAALLRLIYAIRRKIAF